MKYRKIVETSIYSSNLEKMKEFYVDKLGLDFGSEQKGRHVFLKTDKNMHLIFNHEVTTTENETTHGAPTPPSMVHIAFEIGFGEYENAKNLLFLPITNFTNELASNAIYCTDIFSFTELNI